MQIHDFDVLTGKEVNPPQIIWEKDDRYAIIAFLLLSVDGMIGGISLEKLDAFMGTDLPETKNNACDEEDKPAVKDIIIRESNAFLDGLERDESYCDYIMDEIDRVIEGNEKCGIGSGYASIGRTAAHKELPGGAYMLFDYVKLLDSDAYSKNQKRIIKHLAQKWDVSKSVLTDIEDSAKKLSEISKRRHEVENSDMSHREAVSALAVLDSQEKAVWKGLNALNIAKDRATSAYVTNANAIADAIERLGGEGTRVRIRDEDEPPDDDDYKESFTDKIGDGIAEGIQKVGDLICAPFEWMTNKLMGL